jgi:NADH dehydrogenase FAD-containing subunit
VPRPHVVIVGGGFGGLAAARQFRGKEVDITLVDRTNHHLFQPLLYQVATAALAPSDITVPIRWILRRQSNVRVLLAAVRSLDPGQRVVYLDDGTAIDRYDYLIVATGARHSYFGHDQWERFAPGLKNLEDGLTIRRRFLLAFEHAEWCEDPAERDARMTFVIVGDGSWVPAVAQGAIQGGTRAAKNVLALAAGRSTIPFRYINKGDLATIGRNHAIADIGGLTVSGFPAWLLWLFVHILYLVGFRNRLSVLVQWGYAYFTYQRGVRLIVRGEKIAPPP